MTEKSPVRLTRILEQITDDLKELFKDDKFLTATGETRPFKYHMNEVPSPTGEDEDADPEVINAPYILVKILDGSFNEWKYTRKINAAVIFCIYDPSPDKTGHNTILDLIDRVFEHYAQEEWIGDSLITLPLDWTTQTDTDTFPYFFGAFSLELETQGTKIPQNDLT